MSNFEITGVAIKQGNDIYSLPKPARHDDVIKMMVENNVIISAQYVEGFRLSTGEFKDRYDAGKIALETGQIRTTEDNNGKLTSVELW